MNAILALYRKLIPESVRRRNGELIFEFKLAWHNHFAMDKKHYGKLNKDKVFYVVREESEGGRGLFSTCLMVLNSIRYAEKRGWIPVVDYKNYFIPLLQEKDREGKENAWEYYFEPCDTRFSLQEVYQSKNVVLGPRRGQPYGSVSWCAVRDVQKIDDDFYRLVKKYIRIKPEIKERAERIYREIFPTEDKVLGVGIRAGFKRGEITGVGYHAHPKGPDIDGYIAEVHRVMEELGYDYIFVSCDDRYYMERMKKEFGAKCLYFQRELRNYFNDEGNIADNEDVLIELNKRNVVDRNKDYIIEILLLSKCDSLYAVASGGYQMAIMFNNKEYRNCIIYDEGCID